MNKITIGDFLSGTFPLRNLFYHFLSDHDRSADCYWLRLDVFIATGIMHMDGLLLSNWFHSLFLRSHLCFLLKRLLLSFLSAALLAFLSAKASSLICSLC